MELNGVNFLTQNMCFRHCFYEVLITQKYIDLIFLPKDMLGHPKHFNNVL